MSAVKPVNPWTVIIIALAVVIVGGAAVIICRHNPSPPLEITLENPSEVAGEIHIGGDVASPGIYPLRAGDTVEELLRAAGGVTDDAAALELNALAGGETPQRIDINRAEAWLLEALPGIGVTKAAAIVEYREAHGPFRSVAELAKVEGIGPGTVDSIRNMITVGE